MKRIITLTAILVGSLVMQFAEAVPAGTIILASGEVFVRDASGTQRRAAVGSQVESGETVLTQNGRAQVRFTDGGVISLQPVTEFELTNYRFQEPGRTDDASVFKLVKGGLRAITGLISSRNRNLYQLNTGFASIGIRGTEFLALLCIASCKEPDGLYVHTGEGIIFVRNVAGEIDVGKGQTGYVASPNVAPQRTSTVPAVTAKATTTAPAAPAAVPGVGSASEFQPGTIQTTNTLGAMTPLSSAGLGLAASSGSITYQGTTYSASPGGKTGGSGAGAFTAASFAQAAAASNATGVVGVFMNGSQVMGGIVSAADRSNSAIGSIMFDSVKNAGADGGLYWGRWSGTNMNVYAGLNGVVNRATVAIPDTTSIHYILGTTVPTIPTTGTATYSFIGGTPATDKTGVVGSGITSGTLTANFLSNVVGANMTVNFYGTDNVLAATMPVDASNRAAFGTNNQNAAIFSGSAGPVTNPKLYSANVNGFFAGSNSPTAPSRAGVSYDIARPSGAVVGVGAFGCTKGC
jgi:hypothetical protein